MKGCCGECYHWRNYNPEKKGDCRRFPPQVTMTGGFLSEASSHWPQTARHDACGEFKEKLA